MKSIWVVEQGEYSDYRVCGVFTTEENAKLVADAINNPVDGGYEASVAEWPLDPAIDELNHGMHQYRVVMLKDGMVEQVERRADINSYDINGEVRMWRRATAPYYQGKNVQDAMQAVVWATDDTHAIKIVNEHRAQFIATGKWEKD